MEGDEELLAQIEVKVEPKRDEWMTTLPPKRKQQQCPHQKVQPQPYSCALHSA
ncbi:hypothetical protein Fmac_012227 [Flemingia macrophylla]|uniref:Uncharacterized protein n=1 Tax=Flemingia macrophylla TaxID=520843 RepID=A0ABD1MPQ2_9FABA